jgi:Spy/CpxP family protein refolding chaperone
MQKFATFVAAYVIVCACAFCAGAADEGRESSPDHMRRFEQARELIEKVKLDRMQKTLALDDKTAMSVAEIAKRYDQKRFDLHRLEKEELHALRKALNEKNESQIQEILNRIEQRHQAMHNLHLEEQAELKKVLTTEQMAKYLLFQAAFLKEMREKIRDIKQRRGERLPR